MLSSNNLKLIEPFFTSARITGDLAETSIDKYKSSIKKFLAVVGEKYIGDLELHDFDDFILKMKDNGAGNSRISNVISAVKRLVYFLQKEGLTDKIKISATTLRGLPPALAISDIQTALEKFERYDFTQE